MDEQQSPQIGPKVLYPAGEDWKTDPFLFWIAGLPGEGEKINYMSNGAGKLRMFRTVDGMLIYLRELRDDGKIRQEVYEMIIVHSVVGKIAVPDDGNAPDPDQVQPIIPPRLPNLIPRLLADIDLTKIHPIETLARDGAPTAQDALEEEMQRQAKRRRRK